MERVVGHWHRLPTGVVTALSLTEFKKYLDNALGQVIGFFGWSFWDPGVGLDPCGSLPAQMLYEYCGVKSFLFRGITWRMIVLLYSIWCKSFSDCGRYRQNMHFSCGPFLSHTFKDDEHRSRGRTEESILGTFKDFQRCFCGLLLIVI